MNVRQLIEKLQNHDPSAMVVIPGYEGGYNEVFTSRDIPLNLNSDPKWYYGKYDIVEYDDESIHCMAVSIQ